MFQQSPLDGWHCGSRLSSALWMWRSRCLLLPSSPVGSWWESCGIMCSVSQRCPKRDLWANSQITVLKLETADYYRKLTTVSVETTTSLKDCWCLLEMAKDSKNKAWCSTHSLIIICWSLNCYVFLFHNKATNHASLSDLKPYGNSMADLEMGLPLPHPYYF